mgnify:FL=1
MKRRSQKGGEGMFDNLIDKVKGYFTTDTNEQPENNNNINQDYQSNSVTQVNPDSLESKHSTEPTENNINEENENQKGGKTKKKKKSLKLKKKKKKTARKTKSKKNKTKDRKHGSGACQGKPQPEEQQWKPKSGDLGITKYYGEYVTVEGLNGRKDVGKLIKMNGLGDDPRSIELKSDNGSIIQWVDIKKVTHPDERIGEI